MGIGDLEVDVIHGNHLGITAAGSPALDPEHRSQGRFTKGHHSLFAHPVQSLGQADAGGGFPFPGRGRGNGGDQHQFPVGFVFQTFQHIQRNLRFIVTVLFQFFRQDPHFVSDFADGFHHILLCNLDIAQHRISSLWTDLLLFQFQQPFFQDFIQVEVFNLQIIFCSHHHPKKLNMLDYH